MKKLMFAMVLLFSVTVFSQEQKVDYKKIDNEVVQATYYFADNNTVVEKVGFFNKEGKLHGTWISYNEAGKETTIANYNNGKKEGDWTYFKEDKVSVVTYKDNKIVNVDTKAVVVN
ncbi:hypothetical protein ACFQ5N_03125 [Lutibacter holmesii]|uniref:Nicotinic acid mononucleotide adenyltransferase n=1 Tax=Lutibacter holmesii TaxID=1137985 RepID=A0ABW3WKZ2_9FLAO